MDHTDRIIFFYDEERGWVVEIRSPEGELLGDDFYPSVGAALDKVQELIADLHTAVSEHELEREAEELENRYHYDSPPIDTDPRV